MLSASYGDYIYPPRMETIYIYPLRMATKFIRLVWRLYFFRHSTKCGLDWTGGLNWTGLDSWTGLDWTVGLDWTDFNIYF